MQKTKMRRIAFTFIVDTDTKDDSELDNIICHGSEMLFPDYYDEDPEHLCVRMYYQPKGSHWREVVIEKTPAQKRTIDIKRWIKKRARF